MTHQPDISRLQAYCDGELDAAESEQVEQFLDGDEEARAFVAAIGQLRRCVGDTFADVTAPEDLRAQVRAMATAAAEDHSDAPAGMAVAPDSRRPGPIDWIIEYFRRPKQISFAAVAVVILTIAAVIAVGMFGTPIDNLPSQRSSLGTPASDTAQWAIVEHDRCSIDEEHFASKFSCQQMDQAALKLSEFFDVDQATIFDLTDLGFEFVGAGVCENRERGHSAHLMYRATCDETDSRRQVSIFVMRTDQVAVSGDHRAAAIGQWSHVHTGERCRKQVLLTSDSELAYFLVCCRQDDTVEVAARIEQTIARR